MEEDGTQFGVQIDTKVPRKKWGNFLGILSQNHELNKEKLELTIEWRGEDNFPISWRTQQQMSEIATIQAFNYGEHLEKKKNKVGNIAVDAAKVVRLHRLWTANAVRHCKCGQELQMRWTRHQPCQVFQKLGFDPWKSFGVPRTQIEYATQLESAFRAHWNQRNNHQRSSWRNVDRSQHFS